MNIKTGPFEPDTEDILIMKALSDNPYASDDEICGLVHLAVSAVRRRLGVLRRAGYITERQRLADLAKTDEMMRYRIDIQINPNALQKKKDQGKLRELGTHYRTTNPQERLAYFIRDVLAEKCPELIVEEVSILLGDPADLCATVLVPNPRTIFKWVTEHLRGLEEIEGTSTSQVAWRVPRMPPPESKIPSEQPI